MQDAGVLPDNTFGLDDLSPLPPDLDFVAQGVPPASKTGEFLTALVQKSLPGATLESIWRFGNRRLWSEFMMCKSTMPDANPQLLFHGTKEPNLILGSGLEANCDGFDFRRSQEGQYGIGAYFAACAAYPVRIHPRRENADGTFSLIVAEVLLGSVKDLGPNTDTSLRLPPERRPGLLHDSVRGTEKGIGHRRSTADEHGEQFVVYKNNQAYPHFLIVVKLPSAKDLVGRMIGAVIRLRSVHFKGELVYPPDHKFEHSDDRDGNKRRQLLVLKRKPGVDTLSNARFKVERVDSEPEQIRLRSVHWDGELMYVPAIDFPHSDDATGEHRRQVLVSKVLPANADTLSKARFKVELVDGDFEQIRLRSVHFNDQFVYTPDINFDDEKRRQLLVYKKAGGEDLKKKSKFFPTPVL